MKSVNITVNGRSYALACKPEEEQYLMELAEELNQRATEIAKKSEPINDSQMLIMTAISILDELKEAQSDDKITSSLKSVADRVEKLAENTNNR